MSDLNPLENPDFFDPAGFSGAKAAREARAGAEYQAELALGMEQAWLDYMRETQAPFIAAGERALTMQEQMLPGLLAGPDYEAARTSPAYTEALRQAESAALRNAARTGGVRGGNLQGALMQLGPELLNQAALSDYERQLQGFQALGQMAGQGQMSGTQLGGLGQQQIGSMSGIRGQLGTLGMQSAAQQQQATQNMIGTGIGIASLFMSDIRLKKDIRRIRKTPHPEINLYSWSWNKKANKLGLKGSERGYLVQEVEKVWPDLVHQDEGGFKLIEIEEVDNRLDQEWPAAERVA